MTYSSRLRAKLDQQHERQFGQPAFRPPGDEVLEARDLEKRSGGFHRNKKGKCPECYQLRARNGTCGCPEPTEQIAPPARVRKEHTDYWLEEH
jgi:hypothetical protein